MTDERWSSIKSLIGTDWHAEVGKASGVYQIETSKNKTIYVGEGQIASRLSDHKNDKRILKYVDEGLIVTYKVIPDKEERLKTEKYLHAMLKPNVGKP